MALLASSREFGAWADGRIMTLHIYFRRYAQKSDYLRDADASGYARRHRAAQLDIAADDTAFAMAGGAEAAALRRHLQRHR